MCGRYVSPSQAAIERAWNLTRGGAPFPARYNVAPSTEVPILRRVREGEAPELALARWGLVPTWWRQAKLPSHSINARAEEAAVKPMWRQPYRHARCLVPALGWYEWKDREVIDPETGEVTRVRQPHFLFLHGRRPFCFAGLVSAWNAPGQSEPLVSCAILTRAASSSASAVHDRMPVVLEESAFDDWCDPAVVDPAAVDAIVRARSVGEVEHYAVSRRVNNARTEGEDLAERMED